MQTLSTKSPNPNDVFLTETPSVKHCSALCGILHNHGYYTHFHAHSTTSATDATLPEAHIPSTLTHNYGGVSDSIQQIGTIGIITPTTPPPTILPPTHRMCTRGLSQHIN